MPFTDIIILFASVNNMFKLNVYVTRVSAGNWQIKSYKLITNYCHKLSFLNEMHFHV